MKNSFYSELRQITIYLLSALTIIALGTIGYVRIEGWGFLDSLYMTVITLAAVGFSEVHPLSSTGKVFTIVLIILGLGLVTVLFGAIAQKIIHQEVFQSFKGRKMFDQIEKMSGHTIFCGFGKLAKFAAEQLKDEITRIVVIEKDPEKVHMAREQGFYAILGDATKEETLLSAGVTKAKSLVSLLTKDSDNVFVILTCRELSKEIFIFTRAEEEHSEKHLLRAGANRIVSPYRAGGQKIAEGLSRPYVTEILNLNTNSEGEYLQLEEIRIPEQSSIGGITLRDSSIRQKTNVIVAAIVHENGTMTFNPSADTELENGTTLIVLGIKPELLKLEKIITGDNFTV